MIFPAVLRILEILGFRTALPVTVLLGLGVIFTLLCLATIVVRLIDQRDRGKDNSELKLRIQSWWWMVVVFTLALSLNRTSAIIFFALISFLALKEYLSLIPTRPADHRVLFWAYLALVLQYVWIGINWYGMFLIFIPIYVFLFLPMRMVLIGETKGFLRAAGTLNWGLMLTVYNISHVAFLLKLPPQGNPVAGGLGLVFYLVVLTESNDIAQYLWGKQFGHRKIIPTVSPNKTLEGLLGGMATTTVLAIILAPLFTPFHRIHALGIGLLLGLIGFVGDVVISALKRDLGIKDSGHLIPGHGGILDRIDSLTYTAPLFFHFTVYFYYSKLLT